MKRFMIVAAFAALCLTACNEPSGPIPESFPKKQLIEEFTGQSCGYCPNGMEYIREFVANDPNWILVLHHYGFAQDNFTVAGSKTITDALNVDGAPQMTVNRAVTKTADGNATVFHPAYLEYMSKTQFDATTYASVVLENSYDASTRQLKVHVSGALAKDDYPALKLTVLVKESGMIDYQEDKIYSFAGWKEFRHANAVRAFLTDAKGDVVTVKKNRYSADYTLTLNNKWVAENCMVVAFLSEEFKPVVQAEEAPVVAGSKGGADLEAKGITPVPVSDYFPEPSATAAPGDYSGAEADTLTFATSGYQYLPENGFNYWTIMAYNAQKTVKVGSTKCVPFVYLYLFTDLNADTIPAGTYPLNQTETVGSALAGFRNDEKQQIEGCQFYYTSQSYFKQGYLQPLAEWLIADGTLTVRTDGWELIGHARNGADIHLVGTTAIPSEGRLNAPRKAPKDYQKPPFAIVEYDK